ncbi:hypothetical protein [Leptolyngbya sp. FACHB-711]|uniref:hypothetical protein n=1 Tax=unclassified Leptolyngbya TaxID=2650499 RepID=UPI001688479F|nr:hypothetical protein [Leptolyngbya sp. FACHB-711]MBD1849934.1 hypothetical protein [Cyanobacteria bacterium FACHB-502]MBD2025803.1 hypothetical protein [Leptolyngbya sp. FACHB-711]
MHRAFLILASSALAFSITACDSGTPEASTTETTVTQSPSPVVRPNPSPSPAAQNPPAPIVLPDLISSTDPNQRVQRVEGNRNDPFALLPTTPTIQRPTPVPGQPVPVGRTTPPAPRVTQPNRPTAQTPRSRQAPRTAQTPQRQGSPNRPGTLAPIPNLTGRAPTTPIAPPPPQPELARAVQVTGVVQIGGTPYAIVTAPNEPTSRYVRAGQRLSNGQVLVRRIEMNTGIEPVVVLEQFGVEVVRSIGEGGAPGAGTTPAAAVPNSSGQSAG